MSVIWLMTIFSVDSYHSLSRYEERQRQEYWESRNAECHVLHFIFLCLRSLNADEVGTWHRDPRQTPPRRYCEARERIREREVPEKSDRGQARGLIVTVDVWEYRKLSRTSSAFARFLLVCAYFLGSLHISNWYRARTILLIPWRDILLMFPVSQTIINDT